MAHSLLLTITSWAWILSAITSGGICSEDFSQTDDADNGDNPYNYYGNSLADLDNVDAEDHEYTSEEPIDICALTPNTYHMNCRCRYDETSVVCAMFATISEQSDVWDAFVDMTTIERLQFTSSGQSNASYLPTHVLRYLPNLKSLKVEYLHLTSLQKDSFSHLYKLSDVDLNNNHIERLGGESFKDLPELEELTLSENYLTTVGYGTFESLPKLRTLLIDRNHISFIEEGAFEMLENLKELELWGNRITVLTSGTFSGLKNLERLELSDNRIDRLPSKAFSSIPHLMTLALSRNNISYMHKSAFNGLRQLQTLKLRQNHLVTLSGEPFVHLPALLWLDLSHNRLQTLASSVILTLPNLYNRSANVLLEGNTFECDCELYWMYELSGDTTIGNVLREALKMVTCEDVGPLDESAVRYNITSVPWQQMSCQYEDETESDQSSQTEVSKESRGTGDESTAITRMVKDTPETFLSEQSQAKEKAEEVVVEVEEEEEVVISTTASEEMAKTTRNSCQRRTLHIGLVYLISFSFLHFQSSSM